MPRSSSPRPLLAALALLAGPGDFDERAGALEQLAHTAPRAPEAAEALAEASLLQLGLGHLDRAAADADALAHDHRARHPELVRRVALARARRHAGLGEWDALRAVLVASRPAFAPGADVDDRLEAHALLGRALAHLGRPGEAALEARRVLALETRPNIGERGVDALGEAWFFFAEQAGERAAQIVLPKYTGPDTREAVLAHVAGPVQRWMVRKRYAVEVAEAAYARVLGIDMPPPALPLPPPPVAATGMVGLLNAGAGGDPNAPTAPWGREETGTTRRVPHLVSPRWSIAALARVAMAWGELARQLREIPVPKAAHGPVPGAGGLTYEDLRADYGGCGLDPPDRALGQRAREACARALDLGLTHRISDEHTRTCEGWLSRHYPADVRLLEELRPRIAAPRAAGDFAPPHE